MKSISWRLPVLPMLLAMAACSGGSGSFVATDGEGDQLALCVASDCGSKQELLHIPNAENLFFSDDSRLFVSGAGAVWEITRSGDAYSETPLPGGVCSQDFGGFAQRGDVLYVTCLGNNSLWATTLSGPLNLQQIFVMSGMSLANGMASDNQGRLYITDGPTASQPKIVRIVIDPADPFMVLTQETWLASGVQFPNGIVFDGSDFYITDSRLAPPEQGAVRRIPLNPDGSPGLVTTIHVDPAIPDDLSLLGDSELLVTSFGDGRVYRLGKDGTLISQTDNGTWVAASAVLRGQPPLFATHQLVVTDKGVLNEGSSDVGNKLTVFSPLQSP